MTEENGFLAQTEHIQMWLSLLMRFAFLLAGIYSFFRAEWMTLFVCVLALLCLSLPSLLQRNYKIVLPTEFELALTVFVSASLLLGEISGFYESFWWWDLALHAVSGTAFGFLGFLVLFVLTNQKRIEASAFLLSIFIFSFAMMLGGLWEIFEFTMDRFFDLNMQKSGLADTMSDLIMDAAGGLLTAIFAYVYLKRRKRPEGIFHELVQRFLKKNTSLLRRFKKVQK